MIFNLRCPYCGAKVMVEDAIMVECDQDTFELETICTTCNHKVYSEFECKDLRDRGDFSFTDNKGKLWKVGDKIITYDLPKHEGLRARLEVVEHDMKLKLLCLIDTKSPTFRSMNIINELNLRNIVL